MPRTSNDIMDDIAVELERLESGPVDPNFLLTPDYKDWFKDTRAAIFMAEAFQAGQDLTNAKLSYCGQLDHLGLDELPDRAAAAFVFGANWRAQRATI